MSDDARIMRHVVVRGRVQGVGFRAFVERQALSHRLTGWVRNRIDGTVEAVFVGPTDAVEAVIAACRTGPRSGKVDNVEQRPATPDEVAESSQADTFSCLPTI